MLPAGSDPMPPDPDFAMAVEAWKMMGGAINWHALDTVAAYIGAEDPEILIASLLTIKEFKVRTNG